MIYWDATSVQFVYLSHLVLRVNYTQSRQIELPVLDRKYSAGVKPRCNNGVSDISFLEQHDIIQPVWPSMESEKCLRLTDVEHD